MDLSGRTTDELVKVARAGGGLVLEVGKRTADELARFEIEGILPIKGSSSDYSKSNKVNFDRL